MPIQQQLQDDLKTAMRAKDELRMTTIRMALAAIKNLQIEVGHALDDAEAQQALRREIKSRRDSADSYRQAAREDLALKEESEIALLEAYLPQQLSAEQLTPMVQAVVAELGITGQKDLGRLMPVLMQRFKDQADGRTINQVARDILAKM